VWNLVILDHAHLARQERRLLLPSLIRLSILIPEAATLVAFSNSLATSGLLKLRTLSIHSDWSQSIQTAQAVAQFLKACPALDVFDFDVDRKNMLESLDLGFHTGLQQLAMYLHESQGQPLLPMLPDVLRSLRSPLLRTLFIVAVIPIIEQFELVQWREVSDLLLNLPSLNRLQVVGFIFVRSNREVDKNFTDKLYVNQFRHILRGDMALLDKSNIQVIGV